MPQGVENPESQPLLTGAAGEPHESRGVGHSTLQSTRHDLQRFLTSKLGHYAVLLLVSLDVSCIFADFLLSLYLCEHACNHESFESWTDDQSLHKIEKAQAVLGTVSLIFSCLFLAELLASIWAFGTSYFKSKFHVFDGIIIIASFIIDVCMKGVLEEVGSIVIVLRLWRVVKIVDELSAEAQEQMEQMARRLERAERERADAVSELREWRRQVSNASNA